MLHIHKGKVEPIRPKPMFASVGAQSRDAGLRRRIPVWIAAAIIATFTFFPMYGQLQQSGGGGSNASVGSTGATAPTSATLAGGSFNSTLPSLTTGQMGAVQLDSSGRVLVGSIAGALPTGSNTIGTVTIGAGTSVIGTVDTIPKTACGNTVASQALAAVPTTSTAVFTSTTCVVAIVLNNTNSTAATVTVTDNQGTPVNDILSFSIPGNSQIIQPLWGVAFTTGVKWSASATGVTGAVIGYQ